jgi:ribonuclease HII
MTYIIGIDEVGRGPIAGPVVLCACAVSDVVDILSLFPKGVLKDSKKLTERQRLAIREKLDPFVTSGDIIVGLGESSAEMIDTIGLSAAIKDSLERSLSIVLGKGVAKDSKIYLDGSLYASDDYPNQETIIKGDEKIGAISLASIIAKVYRDNLMKKVGQIYSEYGFENHAGYGTKAHYDAITLHGLTPYHRKSFLTKFHKA